MADPKHPHTLLCEACGYVIEGIAPEANCPECGKPIAESLPENRDTPPTIWGVVRRPRKSLDRMPIDDRGRVAGWKRARIAARIIAVTLGLMTVVFASTVAFRGNWPPLTSALLYIGSILFISTSAGALIYFTALICVVGLVRIEAAGISVIAKFHRYRITKQHARAICGYGSTGWIIASVGFAGIITALTAGNTFQLFDEQVGGLAILITIIASSIIMIAGFIFSEYFSWLGLRRCKFANLPRTSGDQPASNSTNNNSKIPDARET